jgi:hypothetical protein
MSEGATLNDLKSLVDKLVQEGYGKSLISFNDEYQFYLGEDGMIEYDIYHGKQGITYIDLLG